MIRLRQLGRIEGAASDEQSLRFRYAGDQEERVNVEVPRQRYL